MSAQHPPRIGYAMLSHRNPDQVERLARRLAAHPSSHHVAVSHDQSRATFDAARLSDLGNVTVRDAGPGAWGHWTQAEGMIGGLRWLRENTSCDWFVILSGQDYPITSLGTFAARLDPNVDAYMNAEPVADNATWGHERVWRYMFRYWPLPRLAHASRFPVGVRRFATRALGQFNLRQSLVHLSVTTGWWERPLIGIRWPRPFGADVPYGGPEWCTLSARAVDAVLGARPDLVTHLQRTLAPSECFFSTVIFNDDTMRVAPDSTRHVRWTGSAHPHVFRIDDLDDLVSSGACLARKFDAEVDSEILDALDRHADAVEGGS